MRRPGCASIPVATTSAGDPWPCRNGARATGLSLEIASKSVRVVSRLGALYRRSDCRRSVYRTRPTSAILLRPRHLALDSSRGRSAAQLLGAYGDRAGRKPAMTLVDCPDGDRQRSDPGHSGLCLDRRLAPSPYPRPPSSRLRRGRRSGAGDNVRARGGASGPSYASCEPAARKPASRASVAVGVILIPLIFPAAIRSTGLALTYSLGVAIFGGASTSVVAWLVGVTGNPLASTYYVMAANVAMLAAILWTANGIST